MSASAIRILTLAVSALFTATTTHGGEALSVENAPAESLRIYVGTYTSKESKGIYLLHLNPRTGALSTPMLAGETTSPSFLAVHPGGRFLYAVNETGNFQGKKTGAVSAFAMESGSGSLALLNQKPSGGGAPCHLAIDEKGAFLLVANYSGGNLSVLKLQADGHLGETTDLVQHQGASIHRSRQKGPHAHCINLDTANRFALSADLGLDKVLVYRFDTKQGRLVANAPPAASMEPGAGPRHVAFAPGERHVYVINELNSTVTACTWDPRKGTLKKLQTISTLPAGFEGRNSTAEVMVSPCGGFLYGSNRGHDSIAVFAIDPKQGRLSLVDHESTRGKTPRNFAITPGGKLLLAANQGSDNVVVFRIDPESGKLEPTGEEAKVSMPVCVLPLATP